MTREVEHIILGERGKIKALSKEKISKRPLKTRPPKAKKNEKKSDFVPDGIIGVEKDQTSLIARKNNCPKGT